MHNRFKAQAVRAPHFLAAPLCRARKSPPLGYDRECGIKKFLPQLSQSVVRFKGKMSYQKRRLYWNYSLDRSMPLRHWVMTISHALFYVSRWRQFNPSPSSSSLRILRIYFSKYSFCFRDSALIYVHKIYDLRS